MSQRQVTWDCGLTEFSAQTLAGGWRQHLNFAHKNDDRKTEAVGH